MSAMAVATNPHEGKLFFYIKQLTSLQWAIFASGFRRAKPGRKLLYLGLLLLAAALVVGIFLLTTYLLGVINSAIATQSSPQLNAFVESVPGLIISLAFLGILVCSFAVLLQALYLANDMDFLLSAPIPIRAVFVSKLQQAILPNLGLVAVICLPILFGLGMTESYSLVYFPLGIVLLAFLAMAAAGIASLLVMAVVRLLPAKRVAEILGFLAAVLFIVLSQWMNLTGATSDSISSEKLTSGVASLSNLNHSWSPLAWAGQGLVEIGQGRYLQGGWHLFVVLAACAGIFLLSLVAAERLYYSGWASMQVSAQRNKPRRKAAHHEVNGVLFRILGKWVPAQTSSIVFKDFKMLRRDLRTLSRMIMPMIMGIVFAVMLLRGGSSSPVGQIQASTLLDDLMKSGYEYGSMLIPVFVSWMLVINLGTIAFSMEGRQYWILKSAPLSSRKLLAAKFTTVYLPVLIVTWLYMAVIALSQHVPIRILVYGLPASALILAGMVGFSLALGVRFANMGWTDPRHMTDGAGSYLAMLAGIVYLILCYVIFIVPPVILPRLGAAQWIGQLAGLLVGGAIALACMLLPLARVERYVAVIGEQ